MENKLSFFFRNQIWHVGGTLILFLISFQFANLNNNTDTYLEINALSWLLIAMIVPLIHQIYVWICWRSELCWKSISNSIKFKGYLIIFFILIVSRFSAVVLCFIDYGSLYKPGLITWLLSIVVFIPGVYTIYSVKKYFGFARAAGADHFDSKYRSMPFERRGIFKWSSNAMYTYGLAIPFGFAIATGSQSMFIVSVYSYISIWLHYFCTEKEDFKVIYSNM